ncbi:MAG: binding--dependent transport system inner rane component family protein [Frankiales bacterium]|nr:binding--dependent transport system inner rane component family protein [Frankiales bacterium]
MTAYSGRLSQAAAVDPAPIAEPGVWGRLRRRPSAVAALVVIGLVVLLAVCAPLLVHLWGHGPLDSYKRAGGLSRAGIPVGPRSQFWLGTDQQGRDVLSRLLYGARVSLLVGAVATLLATVVGTAVGLVAGYVGGWVDTVLSRAVDAVLSLPSLLLAVAFVAAFGGGLAVTIGVLAFFSWAAIARLVRGLTTSASQQVYVAAARSLGTRPLRMMRVDLLPNVLAPVIAYATLLFPGMIIGEVTLSYLGLGVQAPQASWGTILADAQASQRFLVAPWLLVAPAVAIFVTTFAFTVLGDALRDALDPNASRVRR